MSKRKPGNWWDKSWNIVTGCSWPPGEVPEGCRNCWAEKMAARFSQLHGYDVLPYVPGGDCCGEADPLRFSRVICHHDRLSAPEPGDPRRSNHPLTRKKPTVWATSLLGDLFHHEVTVDLLAGAIAAMWSDRCKQHTFVWLTKRYKEAVSTLHGIMAGAGEPLPPNMILMASVWDQRSADAACAAFAKLPDGLRWGLHMEPCLSAIDLSGHITDEPECCGTGECDEYGEWSCCGCPVPGDPIAPFAWVVVGSENGPGARPFELAWAKRIQEQCNAAGIPYWFKGAGRGQEVPPEMIVREVPW